MTLTNAQRLTLLITLAVTAAILIWDWVLLRDGVPGNTISAAIKAVSGCIPIPLVFGIWMGHLFWYRSGGGGSWIQGACFALLVVGAWAWWEMSNDAARLWLSARPHVVLLLGFVAGHWVWPQYVGAGS